MFGLWGIGNLKFKYQGPAPFDSPVVSYCVITPVSETFPYAMDCYELCNIVE